jgi:hypothetical protein
MRQLDENEELLLLSARDALAAIELDGKVQRNRVDQIWRAIAADLLNDEDTAVWARRVAKTVVRDVLDDKSQDRDDRARKALGLHGRGQSDDQAGRTLDAILVFERLACAQANMLGNVREIVPTMKRNRNLLHSMRAAGCYRDLSDSIALGRLRRLLEKRPQAS